MASKRMFANAVIEDTAFLTLTHDAQLIYFHLGMRADEDGFVSPFTTCRILELGEAQLQELENAGFIIRFDGESVVLISHWNVNNTIRKDNNRYHGTIHKDLLALVGMDNNKVYHLLTDTCPSNDGQTTDQHSGAEPSGAEPSVTQPNGTNQNVTQPSGGERSEAPTLGGLAEAQSIVAEQLIGRLRGAGITDPAKIYRVHQLVRDKGLGAASDYVDQEIGRR